MNLGLPPQVVACLFDLDGVLTPTATLHAAAWKEMFDAYLRDRSRKTGTPFAPFDIETDFERYVDGRPRADGTRAFLASRGIELPEGASEGAAAAETIRGLGDRKNQILQRLLHQGHVAAYPGSTRYLREVRSHGLLTAVVSSSRNCRAVLDSAGITDFFDDIVDGISGQKEHLAGKPAPDTYLAAARALKVDPARAAVFEDALSGVEAGRAGRFGYVVGVDRIGQAEALRRHGANVVVADLADLLEAA